MVIELSGFSRNFLALLMKSIDIFCEGWGRVEVVFSMAEALSVKNIILLMYG
jgi:hypothetical protein